MWKTVERIVIWGFVSFVIVCTGLFTYFYISIHNSILFTIGIDFIVLSCLCFCGYLIKRFPDISYWTLEGAAGVWILIWLFLCKVISFLFERMGIDIFSWKF